MKTGGESQPKSQLKPEQISLNLESPEETKQRLIKSIRAKQGTDEPYTEEEIAFERADAESRREDDQPHYNH